MIEETKIEKGIPVPSGPSRKKSGVTDFVRSLQIGDSFVVPLHRVTSYIGCGIRVKIKLKQQRISDTESRLWRIG